jgi:penicillin amidase
MTPYPKLQFPFRTRAALCAALLLPLTVSAADITIRRDTYGTPHVYADQVYGLFYGYGYAIAQDRLYQLEMSRRSTQGLVAEVLGKDYLDFDKSIRQHYDPEKIRLQLAALPQADRDILDGYAAGINRWLQAIAQDPDKLMPKQFIDNGFKPQKWTGFDVAMIFIGSMINRFGDYNTELDNQQLFNNLVAKNGSTKGTELFNLLLPIDNPDAPTTIPKGEWSPSLRDKAFVPARQPLSQRIETTQPVSQQTAWNMPKERAFSNIIVLGANKTQDAHAILLNGPQFGFYQPAYTYSIGLHGAGYDTVGNSPFGYPMVEFGYNHKISWGSTWGAGDNVDIYRLKLNPANPEEYLYQGKYIPFEKRIETIAVKGSDDVKLTVYRSVQGAVVDYLPEKGVAYAKRRGWEGKEVATLIAWNKVSKAQNHQQWLDQVSQSAINVNWYYADQSGNIGYALGGRYPVRVQGHDHRLPVSGDGQFEWQGFMPFSTNPQVYNPSTGYIANWNNKPAEGFPSPDQWWYSWNNADRLKTLTSRIDAQPRFTSEQAWNLMMDAAFEDPNARFFVPRLIKAAVGSDEPRQKEAAHLLSNWNYQERDDNSDGDYDNPATPIFRAWLRNMVKLSFGDLLPKQQADWFLKTGYLEPGGSTPGSQNIEVGTKVVHQAILARESGKTSTFDLFQGKDIDTLMQQALNNALNELKGKQGDNMTAWRTGVAHTTYETKNFLAIPQAEKAEEMHNRLAMNRGTENNLTVFTGTEVQGYEVVAPGQSGFIAPDGTRAKHFDDQLKLFGDLGKKRTWLDKTDVEANSSATINLTY